MKQIIPFKKELLFKTKVSEITSISLEHNLSLKEDDLISGEFIISGDYKMTEGSINREKFYFTLPFDIALDSRYDATNIIIDIDNFYYEVINNEFLQVNIDVYIDGEKKIEEEVVKKEDDDPPFIKLVPNNNQVLDNGFIKPVTLSNIESVRKDEKQELDININYKKMPVIDLDEKDIINTNKEGNFNIFQDIDNSDTYVTYHVYIVKEGDTIDTVMEKYGVKKESLSLYNDIENIKVGTKLIIPYES